MNKAELQEFVREGVASIAELEELIADTSTKRAEVHAYDPELSQLFSQLLCALDSINRYLTQHYNTDGTAKEQTS